MCGAMRHVRQVSKPRRPVISLFIGIMANESAPTKKVQVVGAPPPVKGPAPDPETDSEHEHEHEHEAEEQEHEDVADEDEGIDELMTAFEDDETDIDLTHLRLHSTKRLNLPRFGKTLQRLGLRQNEIRTMRGKDLGACPHLKELDLYDNAIEHINGLENNTELEYVCIC